MSFSEKDGRLPNELRFSSNGTNNEIVASGSCLREEGGGVGGLVVM